MHLPTYFNLELITAPLGCAELQSIFGGTKKILDELCYFTAMLAKVNVKVCSKKAMDILRPLLGESAQWLPLSFLEKEYWLLNVLRLLKIDKNRSAVRRYPDGSQPSITRYAFQEKDLTNGWLFKTRINPFTVHYTDRLRNLVRQEGLTRFSFDLLWDSEVEHPAEPSKVVKH
jgi:hypothetical protein